LIISGEINIASYKQLMTEYRQRRGADCNHPLYIAHAPTDLLRDVTLDVTRADVTEGGGGHVTSLPSLVAPQQHWPSQRKTNSSIIELPPLV